MEKNLCNYFESCSAPLCPLEEESMASGIWYSDEEICHKKNSIKWIRKQKHLVKAKANPDLYFDVASLNTSARIGKSPDALVRREIRKDEGSENGKGITLETQKEG